MWHCARSMPDGEGAGPQELSDLATGPILVTDSKSNPVGIVCPRCQEFLPVGAETCRDCGLALPPPTDTVSEATVLRFWLTTAVASSCIGTASCYYAFAIADSGAGQLISGVIGLLGLLLALASWRGVVLSTKTAGPPS